MRRRFVVFFVPFVLLYALANYYIALRFLPLGTVLLGRVAWVYWLLIASGAGASLAAAVAAA